MVVLEVRTPEGAIPEVPLEAVGAYELVVYLGREAQVGGVEFLQDESGSKEALIENGADPAWYHGRMNIWPNPVRASTNVAFQLGAPDRVKLVVYDLSGRKVSETNLGHFGVGRHVVNWSGLDARGRQVGTGVYVVRLVGQELDATRKVSIIR